METAETVRLRAEVERLRRDVRDLEIALLTSNEHGDYLEDHLYRVGSSLAAEIQERQAAEERLQRLVETITREKGDLEILVQILTDQGDIFAEEGAKARIDALTQIANRRRFDEYLASEWSHHGRMQQPLSVMICDVDHFKLYNDFYGHLAGDKCLKRVADAINACVRPGDLVARYGGEEFAIVLPRIHGEAARRIAERVRATVESAGLPHAWSPVSDRVTLSAGVASRTPPREGGNDGQALIEDADRSLYAAKRSGRNRVSYYDGESSSS
jgi:diguanylate cyclase (GGDEF)-like protein